MEQGVAVLGEHDGGLAEPRSRLSSRSSRTIFVSRARRRNRALREILQQPSLAAGIAQDRREQGAPRRSGRALRHRAAAAAAGRPSGSSDASPPVVFRPFAPGRVRSRTRVSGTATVSHASRAAGSAATVPARADSRVHFAFGTDWATPQTVHAPAAGQRDLLPASAKNQQAVAGLAPMRQSASNAGLLPLCGVAVSSATYDACRRWRGGRRACRCRARRRGLHPR